MLISPSIFVVPKAMSALATLTGINAGLLRDSQPPEKVRSFEEVLVALNFFVRDRISPMQDASLWSQDFILYFLRVRRGELAVALAGVPADGFLRFELPMAQACPYSDWLVAYHGTCIPSAGKILHDGALKTPREGATIKHGQAGDPLCNSIYVSPSKEYAAFPTYSEFFSLRLPRSHDRRCQAGALTFAQIVLEVRVRPDSFHIQNSTLGWHRHWPRGRQIDPDFETNSGLEWLVKSSSDVVLAAIHVREFGPGAFGAFGELNSKVSA